MTLNTHDQRMPRHPELPPRGADAIGPTVRLTWFLVGLVASAGLTGLLLDGIYTGPQATAEMLRAYDLVTVLVVAPALALAAHRTRRGSALAHLDLASLTAYVVYTYAYYLFGTGFNDLFLLHVTVFATGLVVLGLSLTTLDLHALATRFEPPTGVRAVALILGVLAAALGGMWAYLAIDNAVTGDVPNGSRLVETQAVVHLGMALDLTLLVPLYATAALLLWRRAPWGYVLAGLALVAGVLHQLSYVVAMPFQVAADVPGAVAHDPGEPIIVALYVTGLVLLLRGARRRKEPSRS